jgi:hypothetical protein
VRFDHAFNTDAYDNPGGIPGDGRSSQLMLAADLILHF